MPTLTVVTGMPGTRVRRSLEKFTEWVRENYDRDVEVISLDRILLDKAKPLVIEMFSLPSASVVHTFMLPRSLLRRIWIETWEETIADLDAQLSERDVILTLHLTYFHQLTSESFIPADISMLIDDLSTRASRVVTLIDDIYDCQQALIAGGSASGMMNTPQSIETTVLDLIQVLEWRSIETMVSESLSSSLGCPYNVLAVKHPANTLYDLVFSKKPVVYLSHPISEPRRMHMSGDTSGAIALAHKMSEVVATMRAFATVVEPTGIDELRFRNASGNLSARWPFSPDQRDLLYEPPEDLPHTSAQEYVFPVGWDTDERTEIESSGLIQRLVQVIGQQINARDHGLVEQSRLIAAYRPIYRGNVSRGVQEELRHHTRLVASGLRTSEASIVFSPESDLFEYSRRSLANFTIPIWAQSRMLTGDESAVQRLQQRVLNEDSREMEQLLDGDTDALMRVVTACGLRFQSESGTLPEGALGASEIVHQQATAGHLAEQVKRLSGVYLDELVEDGTVRLVGSEQMFYNALQEIN